MDTETRVGVVEQFLHRERAMLRAGRLHELEDLAAERETVFGLMDGLDEAQLIKLRDIARVNGLLASAAAEGVRAALARVKELSQAAGPIGSYSAAGTRQEIGKIRPICERRA